MNLTAWNVEFPASIPSGVGGPSLMPGELTPTSVVSVSSPGESTRSEIPFQDTLLQLLQEVNATQTAAREQAAGLATGQTESIQDVVLAAAKSDLAFHFVLELRNRLIATYQEVMRMQV